MVCRPSKLGGVNSPVHRRYSAGLNPVRTALMNTGRRHRRLGGRLSSVPPRKLARYLDTPRRLAKSTNQYESHVMSTLTTTPSITPASPIDTGEVAAQRPIRRVRVPAWAIPATGSTTNALVLGQLMFWIYADAGRRAHAPSPHRGINGPYVFKSARELAEETGLTASQAERAIAALRRRCIIATKRRMFCGSPTNAAWFTPEGLNMIRGHEGDRRAVSVLPSVVRALEDVNAALLVSQLVYWFSRRDEDKNTLTHAPRPRIGIHTPWIAKTDKQLADESGLSVHQAKRARALLVGRELLRTSRHRFGEGTATCYELNADALAAAISPPESRKDGA